MARVETKNLLTVANYSYKIKKSREWVYKLIREGKLSAVEIDGVKFIES